MCGNVKTSDGGQDRAEQIWRYSTGCRFARICACSFHCCVRQVSLAFGLHWILWLPLDIALLLTNVFICSSRRPSSTPLWLFVPGDPKSEHQWLWGFQWEQFWSHPSTWNRWCGWDDCVADPGGVLPPSEDVSLGNGSIAENGLEVLFTPMSGYGLQREPVLAAPRIDFTWTWQVSVFFLLYVLLCNPNLQILPEFHSLWCGTTWTSIVHISGEAQYKSGGLVCHSALWMCYVCGRS